VELFPFGGRPTSAAGLWRIDGGGAIFPRPMATLKKPVNLALLGCGTVGGGVIRLLKENGDYLATRIGAPLVIRKVLRPRSGEGRVPNAIAPGSRPIRKRCSGIRR